MAFSLAKEKKLKKRLKRLRREQGDNEEQPNQSSSHAETDQQIDDIAREYSKLKRQRRLQRFHVSFTAV